jgi:Zn finger protein HypA/HybF involved in hydrogenase expression
MTSHTQCPECTTAWSLDEMDEQICVHCGYPHARVDDADDYDFWSEVDRKYELKKYDHEGED